MLNRSEKTKKYYDQTLERIRKKVAPDSEGVAFLNDYTEISKAVETGSGNTSKTIYAVLLSFVDKESKAGKHYASRYGFFKAQLQTALTTQVKSTAEESKMPTWAEVLAMATALNNKTDKTEFDLMNCALIGCYVLFPPRRCDYANMRVVYEMPKKAETDFNYCVLMPRKSRFIFNHYKTKKTYGQQVFDIPKPLVRLIKAWIEVNPMGWLFIKESGDPMNEERLSAHIITLSEKFIGKSAGTSQFRHAFINEMRKGDKMLDEKAEWAIKMGHSVETQETYRRKESDE
jgi:hypothetical protein